MTANPDKDDDAAPARHAIRDGIDHARSAVADAYANSRDRAADAYATAREKARVAGRSAAEGLESNPMAALLGGLAIGAMVGALLPRTEREAKMLGAASEKLHGAAREAVDAAREAGREKLSELGLDRDHARDAIKSLLDGVIAAVGTAGTAAMDTARKSSDGETKA